MSRSRRLSGFILSCLTATCLAQGYAVGDKVIFDYHQTPTEGEIIRVEGSQYVIRWKGPYGENERYFEARHLLRKVGAPAPAAAQPANNPPANNPAPGQGYGVGDKVIFDYHQTPTEGEIIRVEGGQYVIRWKGPYGENERYFDARHLLGKVGPPNTAARPANDPAPANNNPVATAPNANPNPGNNNPPINPGGGGGLMTEGELKQYLDANLGGNPWGPNRTQVLDELRRQIMTRGVNWHFSTDSPLYSETVDKYDLISDITRPLDDNFGPPPKRDVVFGTWKTEVNGPTTYSTDGRSVYRHGPIVADTGSITINPGGTYSWKTGEQTFQGTWRPATTSEMQYTGGEGIVLSKGRGGWDWIVTKWRDPVPPNKSPHWIKIEELTTRGEREYGNK